MWISSQEIISIHAPREGGDATKQITDAIKSNISIHAPREGGDNSCSLMAVLSDTFQSTPPARGATSRVV